jgi:hypothetical protein
MRHLIAWFSPVKATAKATLRSLSRVKALTFNDCARRASRDDLSNLLPRQSGDVFVKAEGAWLALDKDGAIKSIHLTLSDDQFGGEVMMITHQGNTYSISQEQFAKAGLG